MEFKEILTINDDNFKAYGKILKFTEECNDKFEVILNEPNYGWRLAVFRYTEKSVKVMENHPESMESFEPLDGTTLLIVAANHQPEKFQVFLLDKPICLYKGIWHQVISISDTASVKITENIEVSSEFYEFDTEIKVVVG